MIIPWCEYGNSLYVYIESPVITLDAIDIRRYPGSSHMALTNVINTRFKQFTDEELELLRELIETKDKDNLAIAYQIITNK